MIQDQNSLTSYGKVLLNNSLLKATALMLLMGSLYPHLAQANVSAQNKNNEAQDSSQTVYQGRIGNYDVSLMLDQAQEHKLSPQEQAHLDEDLKQRHTQERATAEALAHPRSSQQYVQSLSESPNKEPLEATDQNLATNQSYFEQQMAVDMTLSKQSIQLKALPSSTAPAPFSKVDIEIDHPTELIESFMFAGNKVVLVYADEPGFFALTYTLTAVSPEQQADFQNFTQFKQALTSRFQDKENLLFGEYTIFDQQDFPGRKELSLQGFLKKSADGILPEMQNYFFERAVLDKGYLAVINCEFRGNQAMAQHTAQRAAAMEGLCKRILQSYKYQFLAD